VTFEPRTYQATASIGACIAGLAIPDAVVILHGGSGCDIKLHSLMRFHNPTGEVHRRVVCTKITESDLVLDPGEVLARVARDIVRRVKARMLIVTSASFVEIAGLDRERLRLDLERLLGLPSVYVNAPDFAGDLFEGYSRALATLAERFAVPGRPAPSDPARRVNLVGYLFDRPFMEHQGNLDLLSSYVESLGLTLNATLLGGQPSERLSDLPFAGTSLTLPGGEAAAGVLGERLGHARLDVPWPIGIAATRAFLDVVGAAFGCRDAATALADSQEERVRRLLRQAAEPLVGRTVAVFADGPRLRGLLGLCRDLRLVPVLAGALDGRVAAVGDAADGVELLDAPGLGTVESRLQKAASQRAIDLVVGTTNEVQSARRCGIVGVEFGVPCRGWQPLSPSPFLGFEGILATATRILEAVGT
jgi:nitrogenase molybdenum-iron protein alpha/beta subunit